MNAYIKNTEKSQINDLMLPLKCLENQQQAKPKTSRRRENKNKGQNQRNRDFFKALYKESTKQKR
jgi:hypothetical protein